MTRQVWRIGAGFAALALLLSMAVGTARANWAEGLFSEQGHDFGPVPRGSKVRHAFVLTNTLGEPVTIQDVRASCGCTTGQASASIVPTGGSTTVDAEMDTKNFVGRKATTLYVTLRTASGQEAEARLGVSSTILSDIVLNPGTIDLGAPAKGELATQTLTIDRVGMPQWQITRMVSTCKAVDAILTETSRAGDSVGYLLKVTLRRDAPAGTFRDELQLITNDPETPVFPIQVTARVRGELSASPGLLAMGTVTTAGVSQGRFLVRASRPFVVRSLEGDGDGFKASVDDGTPKPVHLITISYHPDEGTTRGDLRHVFRLHTDLTGEPPLDLTATLRIEP